MEQKLFYSKIKEQLKADFAFTLFKKPLSDSICAILQNDNELCVVNNYEESGFVFAPFDTDKAAVLLKPDVFISTTIGNGVKRVARIIREEKPGNDIENAHKEKVAKAINEIRKGKLDKVILSRIEKKELLKVDPISIFKKLVINYPSAFSYLWFHPKVGMWLGATPEVLLQVNDNNFSTMSLAGTQLYNDSTNVLWELKERNEQEIVTKAIVSGLESVLNTEPLLEGPETVKAGNLLHLRTKITAPLKNTGLKKLVEVLHPTPAVCGYPKSKAKDYILENEGYDRTYYTGFLGPLNLDEDGEKSASTALYVNLRCMEIKNKEALIYVGGGITNDSDPHEEWIETINKSQTIKKVLFD